LGGFIFCCLFRSVGHICPRPSKELPSNFWITTNFSKMIVKK